MPSSKNTNPKPTTSLKEVKKKLKKPSHSEVSLDSEGAIARYLKEIDKIKLLTREEEQNLTQKVALGDELSKQKLIQANLRFVVNIAKKYQKRGLPLIDLISEGNLGLITAAEKFDCTRGYHFISYAVWWIKQSILKALSEKTRLIRLPLNRANQLMQMERLRKDTELDGKEEPSIDDYSKKLRVAKETVQDVLNASKDHISLEAPIIQNKRERSLSELIEDQTIDKPEAEVIHSSLQEAIENVLSTLSEKEQKVIKHRYGLGGYKPLSLKQIGELEQLTKERIRQIEKKTIKKLQSAARQDILRPFLSMFD